MLEHILFIIFCYLVYLQYCRLSIKKIYKYNIPDLILLEGTIDMHSSIKFIDSFNKINEEEVYIYVNSNGGDMVSGYVIISQLMNTNKNVTCIAKKAESIAFDIYSFCQKRYVLDDSELFQHEAKCSFEGTFDELNDYYSRLRTVHLLDSVINMRNANLMNVTYEEYMLKLKNDFRVVGGQEIIRLGFADELIEFL